MSDLQEILTEYTEMRENGLSSQAALNILRALGGLEAPQKEELSTLLRDSDQFETPEMAASDHLKQKQRLVIRPLAPRKKVEAVSCQSCGAVNPGDEVLCYACGQFLMQGADDLGVSRLHVALRYDANDNILHVYDLSSANGTYINSQRLHAREMRLLRNGDILQLGRLALQIQFLR
jgi:hypothetical protein